MKGHKNPFDSCKLTTLYQRDRISIDLFPGKKSMILLIHHEIGAVAGGYSYI